MDDDLMEKIKFDRMWRKLKGRSVGDLLITIRRATEEKRKYYERCIGEIFEIIVTDTKAGFKGFKMNDDYLLLIFEVMETYEPSGDVARARLLDYFIETGDSISEELKEYDTRE